MTDMDGPAGSAGKLSIDDVDLMVIALDEWNDAERRIARRRNRRG